MISVSYKPLKIEEIKAKVLPVLLKYNISKAALFGSAARGEMQRGSDVDIIIDVDRLSSGLQFVEIKRKLEQRLNRKVDLVSYNSLAYSELNDLILREAQVIYEKSHYINITLLI